MFSIEMNMDNVGKVVIIRHKDRIYDHYGILDGRGNIIHVHKKKGMITKDPLQKSLQMAIKVSYLDEPFEIRWKQYQRANSLVGSKHEYKFITSNCESWVEKVRTGSIYSSQVDQIASSASTTILLLSAFYALVK